MDTETRLYNLETQMGTLNHGRLDRIEETVNRMEGKIDTLIPLHAKLDTDVVNIKDNCEKFQTDIDWLKDKRYQDEGAKGMMKWLVPVSIALTGILVTIITYALDHAIH
jgi:hypothetical protein